MYVYMYYNYNVIGSVETTEDQSERPGVQCLVHSDEESGSSEKSTQGFYRRGRSSRRTYYSVGGE